MMQIYTKTEPIVIYLDTLFVVNRLFRLFLISDYSFVVFIRF